MSLESQIIQECRRGNAISPFAIYANNRMVALRSALEQNFPSLVKYSGTENIRPLLREFCQCHPPTSPYLVFYGEALARFLRERKLLVEADLAALDRAWLSTLMAPDNHSVSADELTGSEELAKLRLNPGLHICAVRQEHLSLWSSLNQRSIDVTNVEGQSQIDLLFYRDAGMRVRSMPLTDPESLFIECLLHKLTIEKAAERIGNEYPDFSLSSWFARLIVIGALSHDGP